MDAPAETKVYSAMALDPIHVGTGGYRLGRVDSSIVREPGTNLPKLPGTSLSGACRAYAAMVTGRYNWPENGKTRSCAGQGREDTENNKAGHCGSHTCPVCVAFGFARNGSGFQGLAQFADVHLLFFPVHSLVGPVWVTCPAVLQAAGLGDTALSEPTGNHIRLGVGLTNSTNRLNLGWLMLQTESTPFRPNTAGLPIRTEILQRSVLVPNKLFAQIVNDNLEVRTSVSIDPETGAAEEGALFTYEAIPRSAIFRFSITYLKPDFFKINGRDTPAPAINGHNATVQEVVERGLAQFEHLGIGGMNTRGMGRLKIEPLGQER
jgi:CRISPR-associated protein Cmr4